MLFLWLGVGFTSAGFQWIGGSIPCNTLRTQ